MNTQTANINAAHTIQTLERGFTSFTAAGGGFLVGEYAERFMPTHDAWINAILKVIGAGIIATAAYEYADGLIYDAAEFAAVGIGVSAFLDVVQALTGVRPIHTPPYTVTSYGYGPATVIA